MFTFPRGHGAGKRGKFSKFEVNEYVNKPFAEKINERLAL